MMVGGVFCGLLAAYLKKDNLAILCTNSVELSFTRYNNNLIEIFSELSKKLSVLNTRACMHANMYHNKVVFTYVI